MNSVTIPFAILSSLTLASLVFSLWALFLSKATSVFSGKSAAEDQQQRHSALEQSRQQMDNLAEELRQLRELPVAAGSIPIPKFGLNLNKRSHALRLHRRGDSSEQIAAALEIPRQEVDLLIKLHRIALSSCKS